MTVHNEQRNTPVRSGHSILSGRLGPCPRRGHEPRLHRALEAVGGLGLGPTMEGARMKFRILFAAAMMVASSGNDFMPC